MAQARSCIYSVLSRVRKTCALDDVTVIVAPPTDAGVERGNQPVLRRVFMAGNGLVHRGSLSHDGGATGGDAGFEAVQTSSAVFDPTWFSPRGIVGCES